MVALSLLGKEAKTVVVKGVPYFIKPPTIRQIAGIGHSLKGFDTECATLSDLLGTISEAEGVAKALSYAVASNESLTETFLDAPLNEVVKALEAAITMIGIKDFQRLSDLSRSVRLLIANPK